MNTDNQVSELIGIKVANAFWDGRNIYLISTDEKIFRLYPYGDCCSYCYICGVNNPEALKGATILSIEDLEMEESVLVASDPRVKGGGYPNDDGEEDSCVMVVWGHRIHTTKGTCTIDLRVEHNGNYGGWIEVNELTKEEIQEKTPGVKLVELQEMS